MVKHLAAQITANSAPKIAKCAFPKRETYNSSNLLLYKKDKKDNDHTQKIKYGFLIRKVWFLNSQSMVFKIETYNSSKLLLYKREKKDKCAKYVFWKYKVWFLNYKLYFLKLKVWFFASPLNGLVVFFSRLDIIPAGLSHTLRLSILQSIAAPF